jgi:hypothetical protein
VITFIVIYIILIKYLDAFQRIEYSETDIQFKIITKKKRKHKEKVKESKEGFKKKTKNENIL